MAAKRTSIPGVVKNGIVLPRGNVPLPEGAEVEILLSAPAIPPELQAEFTAWERASDEAWAQIDQSEKEQSVPPSRWIVTPFGQQLGVPSALPREGRTEEELQQARERFRRHFGTINSGDPRSADNERIDADLARAYGDSLQGEP